jgi:hypothetical protein
VDEGVPLLLLLRSEVCSRRSSTRGITGVRYNSLRLDNFPRRTHSAHTSSRNLMRSDSFFSERQWLLFSLPPSLHVTRSPLRRPRTRLLEAAQRRAAGRRKRGRTPPSMSRVLSS